MKTPDYEKAAELLIDKVDKLREQIVELKAENKKLRETLEKYGQHNAKCRESMLYDSRCTQEQVCVCGLDEALI